MKPHTIPRFTAYILLSLLALLTLLPVWLSLVNATRSTSDILSGISLIPGRAVRENLRILLANGFDLRSGFANSLFIALSSTLLSVYFSAMTAYALTAYEFPGKRIFFMLVMGIIMVPGQLSFIGNYRYLASLNLINSFIPLIIPSIAAPATVFFMRQYLERVYSPSLVEAARIDAAGELRIFNFIMLPIMKPALATMGIMGFIGSWNNFMTPYLLLTDQRKYTLPILIQLLKGNVYGTEYGAIYLGIALSLMPIIILFILFSKHIVSGIGAGSLKE